jgi:hypothetical protein
MTPGAAGVGGPIIPIPPGDCGEATIGWCPLGELGPFGVTGCGPDEPPRSRPTGGLGIGCDFGGCMSVRGAIGVKFAGVNGVGLVPRCGRGGGTTLGGVPWTP